MADIFGHLTLRYTHQRVHSVYKGLKESKPYEVVGVDSESVAVRYSYDEVMKGPKLYHIHFEGDHYYWIAIGRQREWFKRVRRKK